MKKKYSLLSLIFLCPLFFYGQDYKSGPEPKDYIAYLFTYFGGDGNSEAVRYAISLDGYNYKALNNNKPVLDSKEISRTGGVRDPHILRGEDKKTFYMVLTDMVAAKGWDSNRGLVLLKSTDLIHWQSTVINIQERFSGNEDLLRVWAPQTIFDKKAGKYMVYWSMKHGADGADIIYYAYANKEFTDFEEAPKVLFMPKNKKSCIDGDIIYKDGVYHMFYKTEGHGNGIKVATTKSLASGDWIEFDDYKQQTQMAVEGSCVFKLNNSDKYMLIYDVYRNKEFHFCESTDLINFKAIDEQISMDFHPRHGTVIPITRKELHALTSQWGMPDGFPVPPNNPVLEGFHADPDIMYSEKMGKYYMYPTSDGYENWGGYYFKVFSSDDLKFWKDEGVILDLKKDAPWAGRNAWAPTMIEKKINGEYKYFYYYTGAQKIGVATSDSPTGSFKDLGKPLIADKPAGINRGQEIDPQVFCDPLSGKNYLYWGNGYLAVVELNEDMISIKDQSLKIIPLDGTFREGIYVIYRDGTYYFTWSENDTRSEDYRVRYGTSKSPLGPVEISKDNLILNKVPELGIYGTGHHSVIQVPGKDEWYIVYHRFNIPDGINMGRSAGYHREVCIEPLEFNADGSIKPVVPTL